MKFVYFKSIYHNDVYVNPEKITHIQSNHDGTYIFFNTSLSELQSNVKVKETAEEVMKKLMED